MAYRHPQPREGEKCARCYSCATCLKHADVHNKWDAIKRVREGWFFPRDRSDPAYCPDHLPAWVGRWRERKKQRVWIAVELAEDQNLDVRDIIERANKEIERTGFESSGLNIVISRGNTPIFGWRITSDIRIAQVNTSEESSQSLDVPGQEESRSQDMKPVD